MEPLRDSPGAAGFRRIARLRLRIPAYKNPFEVYHRVIISIDTLKNVGRYRHFLENTRWDVVVIDEAHNVAGATYPETQLQLSPRSAAFARDRQHAPHHRYASQRQARNLRPADIAARSFGDPDPKLREYTADDIKPFFLMRFKEDVRGEAGAEFPQRRVIPLRQKRPKSR